jgi:predicted dehydrogenase
LATMDAMKQYFTIYSHKVGRPTWNVWGSDSNAGMLAEFVTAIREQRLPAVTGEDGLRAAEIVEAAYESAASGQPVKIG